MEGMRWLVGAAVALLAPCDARASDDAQWYMQVDNDAAFISDRWYTSGVRIARSHRSGDAQRIEWGVVQEIYTPNTNRFNPVDRPYVARLFFSGARHDYAPGAHRTLELTAGVRGPAALGRETQDFVHRVVPAPEDDWSRQLPNRLDLQAIAVQSRDLAIDAGQQAQGVLHYGAVVGTNVTLAHAGVEVRAGQPIEFPALRFAPTPPLATTHGWSAFAGASGRWVLRNTLLAGSNDPTVSEVRRNPGVARLAAGLAWANEWGVVTFALVQDSREFRTQQAMQRFGILTLHLSFL